MTIRPFFEIIYYISGACLITLSTGELQWRVLVCCYICIQIYE